MIYKRVLLKLSGEALSGDKGTGFDEATCIAVAKQIQTLVEEGCQVAIVIGGGNFWRGRTSETIQRNQADQIGMLATVMNCGIDDSGADAICMRFLYETFQP